MKKIIVFGKHYEKINSVFGERPNNSLALCSEFQLARKKKLIEGPEFFYFSLVIHHITVRSDIGFRPTPLRDYEQQKQRQ